MSKVGKRRIQHLRWLLRTLFEAQRPVCYFCGDRLNPDDLGSDASITLHHTDYRPPVVAWAHSSCHRRHHLDERRLAEADGKPFLQLTKSGRARARAREAAREKRTK